MREIKIETTWRATATIEVADDYEAPNESGLDFGTDADGGDIAEQLVCDASAELVDWRIL
jgi:hypothetical protein